MMCIQNLKGPNKMTTYEVWEMNEADEITRQYDLKAEDIRDAMAKVSSSNIEFAQVSIQLKETE